MAIHDVVFMDYLRLRVIKDYQAALNGSPIHVKGKVVNYQKDYAEVDFEIETDLLLMQH